MNHYLPFSVSVSFSNPPTPASRHGSPSVLGCEVSRLAIVILGMEGIMGLFGPLGDVIFHKFHTKSGSFSENEVGVEKMAILKLPCVA